jgi:hypothetical protein
MRRIPASWRGVLAATGALAAGLWLGVAVGLATRPKRDQPSGPPVYDAPGAVGGPEEPAGSAAGPPADSPAGAPERG